MITVKGLKGLSLTDVMEAHKERTFIVFNDGAEPRWWNRWCKKGFKHCFILYYDGMFWYKIERLYGGIEFRLVSHLNGWVFEQCQNISRYYNSLENHTVLEVDCDIMREQCGDKMRCKFPLVLNTCTEFVKDWVALRSYWVLTPYQLYNKLKVLRVK